MKTCSIEGCETKARSRAEGSMCEKHYYRMRRNGTLALTHPQRDKRGTCTVDGCELVDVGRAGFCAKHYARLTRHGDPTKAADPTDNLRPQPSGPTNPCWRGRDVAYSTAHSRVRSLRGRASNYGCEHCDNQADDWAYNHSDPDELISDRAGSLGMRYSPDPMAYISLCKSCHIKFDKRERVSA